ncbi:MAG: energy transducer TonB [Burkholderiales bacterium]|nr:energy transducer TonB [Burkholderiales bacterium]
MNKNTPPLLHSGTALYFSKGLMCAFALSAALSGTLSGCGSYFSKGPAVGEKAEERYPKEMPATAAVKPPAQESSASAKPVATSSMSYPARAVPRRIEASTQAQNTKETKEKKKEPENDSALNGYRLALIDSIEAANANMVVARLTSPAKDKVVLRLRVGQEGKPRITVIKPSEAPEFVEAAKSAVERSTPLLPSPTPKASVVIITFLFGSDNRFKLQ